MCMTGIGIGAGANALTARWSRTEVLTDRVQQHRVPERGRGLAEDVDGLGLQDVQYGVLTDVQRVRHTDLPLGQPSQSTGRNGRSVRPRGHNSANTRR